MPDGIAPGALGGDGFILHPGEFRGIRGGFLDLVTESGIEVHGDCTFPEVRIEGRILRGHLLPQRDEDIQGLAQTLLGRVDE